MGKMGTGGGAGSGGMMDPDGKHGYGRSSWFWNGWQ